MDYTTQFLHQYMRNYIHTACDYTICVKIYVQMKQGTKISTKAFAIER